MTKLLLRLFVKENAARGAVGKLSGLVGIVCNLLLFGLKLAVGTLAGAVSITADAMNNLSDATSSIVTFAGFKLAEKPADKDHPYGHARYEYLSALAVAVLIMVIGFELAKSSVEKILNPTPVLFSLPVWLVLLSSVLLKLWMYRFNRYLGKQADSTALLATAADSRNDAIATSAVLLSGVLSAAFDWQIDGWMGLGVALFILYSGCKLVKETINPLLGENVSPQLRQQIEQLLGSEQQVMGYHDLLVHDYGPGQRFASVHVEMDWQVNPLSCHECIDALERACLEQYQVHLIIHYDPVVTGDAEQNRLQEQVQQLLQEVDGRITIHDFRLTEDALHPKLRFDATLPPELMGRQAEIRQTMAQGLPEEYELEITFDLTP